MFPSYNTMFDIMTGAEFLDANNTFESMYRKLRKEGKGQIGHNKAVKKGDVQKLSLM